VNAESDAPHPADEPEPPAEPHPAREMSMHLLRMLETRMDAAGIALQGEVQLLMARLQLKLLAGAAICFAIWGGIVLLAIALPEDLRAPVLGAVVGAFVITAVVAQWVAKRKASPEQVGSLRWFLDSLRQDLELLSRALARPAAKPADKPADKPATDRSTPSDLAA
jgi:uncharacterized membrane protein YqjE